jgi:hypothetical protein
MPNPPNPFAAGLRELGLVSAEPAATREPDPRMPVVAEIVDQLLAAGDVVTPIAVLVRLEIVTEEDCAAWRRGQLPYLERAITAGLQKVGRILRALEAEATDRGLTPKVGKYLRSGKGPKRKLRFSKRGDAASEALYTRHYVRAG